MYDADRHARPSLQLTESQNDLVARARRIAVEVCRPGAAETDRTEEYPWKVVEALTAEGLSQTQITIAAMLAFGGMLSGIWAYMRLVRASESSGYARASGVLDPQARRAAQEQWEA